MFEFEWMCCQGVETAVLMTKKFKILLQSILYYLKNQKISSFLKILIFFYKSLEYL